MDLLEDFNTVRTTFADLSTAGERFDNGTTDDGLKDRGGPSLGSPSVSYDGPALSVDVTVRQAARWDRLRVQRWGGWDQSPDPTLHWCLQGKGSRHCSGLCHGHGAAGDQQGLPCPVPLG
jgi:hypothetical protein